MTSDGQHYTGGDYPVILPAGSTKETLSIPIVDDDIVELDKTFFLTLVIPQQAQDTGVLRGDPYMATVTIINDDGECSVTTLPLTYTHSSAARIHGCINSLLGHHAVKATLGLLHKSTEAFAYICSDNIPIEPCLWISYCMAMCREVPLA